jgi:hypothetical protein
MRLTIDLSPLRSLEEYDCRNEWSVKAEWQRSISVLAHVGEGAGGRRSGREQQKKPPGAKPGGSISLLSRVR